MKSIAAFTIASTLVASVWAQDNNEVSLIPTGITSSCTSFLQRLNSDEALGNCFSTLNNATAAFDPTGSEQPDRSAITPTLDTISSSFASCRDGTIRASLADFYASCSDDLIVNPNPTVISVYDALYLASPLSKAICARDDDGQYCVNKVTVEGSNRNVAARALLSARTGPFVSAETLERLNKGLYKGAAPADDSDFPLGIPPRMAKRQDDEDDQSPLGVLPDADTYRETNLPYLFINPNYTQEQLCTTCTYNVLKEYITFESLTPYALGLANSPILGGQLALWEKIKTCPSGFANNLLNDAIPSRTQSPNSSEKVLVGSVSLGFVALLAASMLF